MSLPILAPNSSWFRPNNSSITKSIITEINIVDTYTVTGNEIDSWDASAANDGSVMVYVTGTVLTIAGNGSGKVYANEDSSYVFGTDNRNDDTFNQLIKITGSSILDTSKATTFYRMFTFCKNLISIDVSNWDTSSVTDMAYMFASCTSLITLNLSNWNVSNVTTMQYTFGSSNSLGPMSLISIGDVSNWDTSNVTNMRSLFYNCSNLISLDLSNWNTSKVTTMYYTFRGCSNLTHIDGISNWNVSNVNDMFGLFSECYSLTSLDLSNWDISNVTTMFCMFLNCTKLTSIGDISNWNTSNANNIHGMFEKCHSLTTLDLSNWDVSSITDMGNMFYQTISLHTLNISNWNISNNVLYENMLKSTQPTIIGIEKLASIIPTLAPNSTWFTPNVSTITRSTITEIEIVNSYTPTGSETDSWDASNAKDGRVMAYVEGTKLIIAGNGIGKVFANEDSSYAFSNSDSDKFINLTTINGAPLLNTSNVTDMSRMFQQAGKLVALDVSNWNTSNVTNMRLMFGGNSSIPMSLESLDISTKTTQDSDSSYTAWDVSSVTDMAGMFQSNANLNFLNISNWNTQSLTTTQNMFKDCVSLTSLDVSGWDTTKITNMASTFSNCASLNELDISNWNTSNITNMSYLFAECASLKTLNTSGWITSSCTNMDTMFRSCTSLKNLDVSNWDVSKVKIFNRMFYGCSSLTSLDLSKFNTSNATYMGNMFTGCFKLERITLGANFSFDGNGNITTPENMAVLPTPSAEHIPGADGKWHSIPDYTEYEPSTVPSKTAGIYIAVVKATLAPNSTWFSQGGTGITRSSITEIEIVDSYTPTGNETASWDASVLKDSSVMVYVNGTKLTIAGCGIGKIYANMDSSWVFSDSAKKDYYNVLTTIIGGNLLNTNNAITMERMFQYATALENVDVSNWNTENVTSMKAMFQAAASIGNLEVGNWKTGKVTDMTGMFNMPDSSGLYNNNLTSLDVSKWDMSKVKSLQLMFTRCSGLSTLNVTDWDTSSCETMYSMFAACKSLETLDVSEWNVSKVTNMRNMFRGCTSLESLDVSEWNVSKVNNFDYMFSGYTDDNDVIQYMNIQELDISKWQTTSAENMSYMFFRCSALTSLDLSGFDTSNVTTMEEMFFNCPKLEKITLGENFAWVGTDGYLPMPSSDYIIDADGYWHTGDGSVYSSASIPSKTANVYYAYPRANKNYIIDGVLLTDLSRTIREKTNTSTKLTPSDMNSVLAQLSFTKGVKF